ncbi:unnamed protein product [Chrysoparadoxa australica]
MVPLTVLVGCLLVANALGFALHMGINKPSLMDKVPGKMAGSLAVAILAVTGSLPLQAEELPEGTTPFSSICMGFGCGAFRGTDYDGAEKPTGEDSIDFKDFLALIDKNEVEKVEFYGPNGDQAYAFVGGKKVRIGAGFPAEQSAGWSSPLWVVRALQNHSVPYKFMYVLGEARSTSSLTVHK